MKTSLRTLMGLFLAATSAPHKARMAGRSLSSSGPGRHRSGRHTCAQDKRRARKRRNKLRARRAA